VSAQPLEQRISRLEGAYEQTADRLNGIEQRMTAGFAQVDLRFVQLEQRMDSRFAQVDTRFAQLDARFSRLNEKIDTNLRTMITWMLGQTAVILGAFAAFALHH
jgi:hypothetical protein